ncbi:MAG: hypothetical protein A2808_00935 [Candidatus Moranbacteria bacterium RIFCSPHIGHO2_01_FULL_55_24]|nr:MAG: hypothetical protein A2808_00935 [Candidatus Moranbacteria bacterium RIFCSPHIGHO2_01_FULL_55_24]
MRIFLFISLFITLAACGIVGLVSYQAAYSHGSVREERSFSVLPGERVLALGERLETEGLIVSRYAFAWEIVKEKKTASLIAGEYLLSGTETIQEIVHKLTSGETVSRDIKVTFPEGWTIDMMAERLTKNGLPGDAFRTMARKPDPNLRQEYAFLSGLPAGATLEGYLFPDTYRFAPDATADTIIQAMLGNFGKRVNTELREAARAKGKSLFEIVTLASIVEEEGRSDRDRGMISDIFWKRLAIGQPLQSDATVNYVLGTYKDQPTLADLESDSPYNTYKHAGLPPGPISNPGLVSLRAAIFPIDNPYYYFLNNIETRETVFSKTFEEHVANRAAHGL